MKTLELGKYTGGAAQRALLAALSRVKRPARFGTSALAGQKRKAVAP